MAQASATSSLSNFISLVATAPPAATAGVTTLVFCRLPEVLAELAESEFLDIQTVGRLTLCDKTCKGELNSSARVIVAAANFVISERLTSPHRSRGAASVRVPRTGGRDEGAFLHRL